jgi:hypothetical protein
MQEERYIGNPDPRVGEFFRIKICIMDKNQWSQFKLRVNVNTDMESAYRSWATPGGLESWFLRKAFFKSSKGKERKKDDFIREGDSYEWYWHGYPDVVVEKGVVLSANGQNNFSFTFSMKCPVIISIYKDQDELIVELIESDLPTDNETVLNHFVGDSRGWIFYLTNLKSVLEGGLDLRNKKVALKNVITA